MIRILLLLCALAGPAAAQTARVLSGEHGDFTRLVIELPQPVGWTLGRTETGYGFATLTAAQPLYDLTGVWQRISRTRLDTLAAAPEGGALALGLACDCHVLPFEYRPGVIVLDIKPGPPPKASGFEAPFVLPATRDTANTPEARAAYDWLADRKAEAVARPAAILPLPLDTGAVSLEPLRDELLEQIARGAADGVVDMELPGKPGKVADVDHSTLPWSSIRIGEVPGVVVSDAYDDDAPPEPTCADPALLDLPSWGGDLPVETLLAETRVGLYGEFDAPEPQAIRQAVRRLLYLGFGAEARQTAELIGDSPPDTELALLRSIALLVDGQSDPQTPFAAMLDCDGPAALWAALAHDRLPSGPGVNRDAILQAFLALPAHLRRHLGPALAERLLARDDAEAARMIRDAMERTPEVDPATVALLDARADLRQGDAAAAQTHAETAVALDGNQAAGLVALVEAHVRTLDPLGSDTVEALLALRGETKGTPEGVAVSRAVVLALALSGQTAAAFRDPGAGGQVLADLWRVAADRATDDDFLVQAVLPETAIIPEVSPDTGLAVAERLLSLGFPDAARVWLGPIAEGDSPERLRLAARAALKVGDARGSIALIQGLDDTEAEGLRAQAMVQLGDLPGAASALAATGNAEAAARLGPWMGDWAGLDRSLPTPWQQAAEFVAAAPAGDASGPLGRGGQAIAASISSRAAIEALLASVALPAAE
jgi:hypothetical protein